MKIFVILTQRNVYEVSVTSMSYYHFPKNVKNFITTRTQEGEVWLVVTEGAFVTDSKNDTKRGFTLNYHTNSHLYRWTGHYFDRAGQLPAASPRHAHHFTIARYHFLALACYTNNIGELSRIKTFVADITTD